MQNWPLEVDPDRAWGSSSAPVLDAVKILQEGGILDDPCSTAEGYHEVPAWVAWLHVHPAHLIIRVSPRAGMDVVVD